MQAAGTPFPEIAAIRNEIHLTGVNSNQHEKNLHPVSIKKIKSKNIKIQALISDRLQEKQVSENDHKY